LFLSTHQSAFPSGWFYPILLAPFPPFIGIRTTQNIPPRPETSQWDLDLFSRKDNDCHLILATFYRGTCRQFPTTQFGTMPVAFISHGLQEAASWVACCTPATSGPCGFPFLVSARCLELGVSLFLLLLLALPGFPKGMPFSPHTGPFTVTVVQSPGLLLPDPPRWILPGANLPGRWGSGRLFHLPILTNHLPASQADPGGAGTAAHFSLRTPCISTTANTPLPPCLPLLGYIQLHDSLAHRNTSGLQWPAWDWPTRSARATPRLPGTVTPARSAPPLLDIARVPGYPCLQLPFGGTYQITGSPFRLTLTYLPHSTAGQDSGLQHHSWATPCLWSAMEGDPHWFLPTGDHLPRPPAGDLLTAAWSPCLPCPGSRRLEGLYIPFTRSPV